jgi:hypothetical protein
MALSIAHLVPRNVALGVATVAMLLGLATPGLAWQGSQTQQLPPPPPPTGSTTQTPTQTPPPQTPPATPPAGTPPPQGTPAKPDPAGADPDRIFGVLPNYTTVMPHETVLPITSKDSFKMAALDSFDPMVYPLFAFIAGVNQATNSPESYGQGWSGYAKRYGVAFADNTVCSLMTTGLLPSLLGQDPRYYQGKKHGFFNRVYYAASRSAVTRTKKGDPQFNLSEVGGTFIVAVNSNLYYPQEERNWPATMQRWGTQAMWDTLSNELKEFWPDIRKKLHWG